MNSNINWIFLPRLLIQNHIKLSITEKREYKFKYFTWISVRLEFVKKTYTNICVIYKISKYNGIVIVGRALKYI